MSDRNTNLPVGPNADALGTLLMYLYQDIVAGKVAPGSGPPWQIKSWRGIDLVHVEAFADGLQVTFWIDGGGRGVPIRAHTERVPTWMADRVRMIWTELRQHDAIRCLALLER